MSTGAHDIGNIDQILQTLKTAFELKGQGILSETDYIELKAGLLSAIRNMDADSRAAQPLEATPALPPLEIHAGDFHRIMVQRLYEDYAAPGVGSPESMLNVVETLIKHRALAPEDLPHMRKIIDIVCNGTFGQGIDQLMLGSAELQSADDQVRYSTETSRLAKAVSGIARNSAQNAVFGIESSVHTPSPSNVTVPPAPIPSSTPNVADPVRRWGIVKDDVNGALSGAGLAVGVVAMPGGAALAALTAALGPALPFFGVIGALLGAGVISGIEWARTKRSGPASMR
jgi:hypothetical protein